MSAEVGGQLERLLSGRQRVAVATSVGADAGDADQYVDTVATRRQPIEHQNLAFAHVAIALDVSGVPIQQAQDLVGLDQQCRVVQPLGDLQALIHLSDVARQLRPILARERRPTAAARP
jgi:hypothetical protein